MAIFDNIDTFEELYDAIDTANHNGEVDTIHLTGNITLTDALPVIEEDQALTLDGDGFALDGDNAQRILFVKSGNITIDNVGFHNGTAQGTSPGGGGGAGMGGALFIYGGSVTIQDSEFINNRAIGGDGGMGGQGGGLGLYGAPGTPGTPGEPGTTGVNGSSGIYGGDGYAGYRGGDSPSPGGEGGWGGSGGAGGAGGQGGSGGTGGNGYAVFYYHYGYYGELYHYSYGGYAGNGGDGGRGGDGSAGGLGGFGGGGGEGGAGGLGGYGGDFGVGNAFGYLNFGLRGYGGDGGEGGQGGGGGFGGGGGSGGAAGWVNSLYSNYENKLGGAGGLGGFGGGGGGNGPQNGSADLGTPSSLGGFGAGNGSGIYGGGGAGMGGAIFIRSGALTLVNSDFTGNSAVGGVSPRNPQGVGMGYGGAIFALHTTSNSNGNQAGMPTVLPEVSLNGVTFSGNLASNSQGTLSNNDNLFGEILQIPDNFMYGDDNANTLSAAALLAAVTLIGNGGNDVLKGSLFDDQIYGGEGHDILLGKAGNDLLDGGLGADNLRGGTGDDYYRVDNDGDFVSERPGNGHDTVEASISHTLDENIEDLVLARGRGDLNGTGNRSDNALYGNEGNNVLNGKGGNNLLVGHEGDDIYIVARAYSRVTGQGDRVVESANEGNDTVRASVSYTLGNHVENLELTGRSLVDGVGNALANHLTGNFKSNYLVGLGGDDVLEGKNGNDTLSGGSGHDQFVFNDSPGIGNSDHITDFTTGEDELVLSHAVFSKLFGVSDGKIASENFVAGNGAVAHDIYDFIVYDTATGQIFYDRDGSRPAPMVEIVTLDGAPTLSNYDFHIIA